MELTMRLLVCHIALFAVLLLVPTIDALGGYPSLSTSIGSGKRSRQEELINALQFLEEYERNLGDTPEGVEEDDWSPQEAFQFLERNDPDEDIVPDDFWDDEDEDDGNTEDFNIFLQNLLQGANSNDVMSNRYYTPQRSSFSNNQDVLFSPVDADLEDEIKLDVEIEKFKVQQKEERPWEDILGDMVAEEILEADAREDIKELIDSEEEEAQLEDVLEEDTIFEEAPWSEIESSEAEESDVVSLSWAEPEWGEGGEESSLAGDFDTEELTSSEEDEVEREAAVLLLEEMLAEEEGKRRQEEEQQEILEMVLNDESSYEDEQDKDTLDEFTEEAIENYFRALLDDNNPDEEILYDDDEEEIILGTSSEAEEEGSDQTSSVDIWEQLSSGPEDEEAFLQEVELSDEEEPENDTIDYEQLLRAIDNEIQAAADEVEEEMVAALTEPIEKKTSMRYLEEDDEFEDETNDASNEINEVDAANFLAEMLYQEQEKRTGFTQCPVLSNLVDSCAAVIEEFPDVDIDRAYYRNKFQRACNRHQLCYTCGANYDIEAQLCDEVFDAEMLAECGRDDECNNVASQFLLIATNTHPRMSQPPKQCQAKCLLQVLIKDD